LDELETTHEWKGNGVSKEDESHVATSRRNEARGKKKFYLLIYISFLAKINS
jgi:hypothetical protein